MTDHFEFARRLLTVTHPEQPGSFIEVRHRRPNAPCGPNSTIAGTSRPSPAASSRSGTSTTSTSGCFRGSSGALVGLDALRHGHVLFADVDTPEAVGAVAGFDPWPSVTVRTSDAGLHCYPTAGLAAWLDRQASAPVDDLIRRRAA